MEKNFLCRFSVTMCDTEVNFFYIDQGENKTEVVEKNEVEHDECGLDTAESPVGGCIGEKCTELEAIYEVTPAQVKFLNSVGIH
jgi:hypothetical protein